MGLVPFLFPLFLFVPSVLWRCWLGGRKGIRPVKNSSGGVLAWLSVWSKMQTCIWPSWCHCHSLSLASVKSRLVLPFWYRLTRVVTDKGPLNMCVCYFCLSSELLRDFSWHLGKGSPWCAAVAVARVIRMFHCNSVVWRMAWSVIWAMC